MSNACPLPVSPSRSAAPPACPRDAHRALAGALAAVAPGATIAVLTCALAPDGPRCSAVHLGPHPDAAAAERFARLDGVPWPFAAAAAEDEAFHRTAAAGAAADLVALLLDGASLLGAVLVAPRAEGPAPTAALARRLPAALHHARRAATAAAQRWGDGTLAACLLRADGLFGPETAAAQAWLSPDRRERLTARLGAAAAPPAFALDDAWVTVEPLAANHDGGAAAAASSDALRLVSLRRLGRPVLPVAALLSPRQRQICDYAAAGATVEEIARALGRSANTIKHHLKLAYETLGVSSRLELSAALVAPRGARALALVPKPRR